MRAQEAEGSSPSAWLGFASGVVAGATGVLVGHAFDTLKVQAQVGHPSSPTSSLTFGGVLRLYRGILPPLITTGAIRSLYFGIFENVKRSLSAKGLVQDASLLQTTAASAMTGLATAPITSPFVTIKCHQQINGGSLREAVGAIWRHVGPRGFFRGFGLHCSLECVGSTVYLSAYHHAKRTLRPGNSPTQPFSPYVAPRFPHMSEINLFFRQRTRCARWTRHAQWTPRRARVCACGYVLGRSQAVSHGPPSTL